MVKLCYRETSAEFHPPKYTQTHAFWEGGWMGRCVCVCEEEHLYSWTGLWANYSGALPKLTAHGILRSTALNIVIIQWQQHSVAYWPNNRIQNRITGSNLTTIFHLNMLHSI